MCEVLSFKQVPADLKRYWAEEAKRHDRSLNKEALRFLEAERARREATISPAKDMENIMAAARRLQSFAMVDPRPIKEILYGAEAMPE